MTRRSTHRRRSAGLSLTAALLPVFATAADAKEVKKEKSPRPPAARAYVASEHDRLEQEIAAPSRQHAALSAGASGWPDLRIDSRVIWRWICDQMPNVDANSDTQAVPWVRDRGALSRSATLHAANRSAAPTLAQAAALAAGRPADRRPPLDDLAASAAAGPASASMPADLTGPLYRVATASDHTSAMARVCDTCCTTDLVALTPAAPDTDATEVATLHDRLPQTLNRALNHAGPDSTGTP